MTTLSKRATPAQNTVMRMIGGACLNAATAHPDWEFDPRLVASISKRATGTLTGQWPEALARSKGGSDSVGVLLLTRIDTPGTRAALKPRAGASQSGPW